MQKFLKILLSIVLMSMFFSGCGSTAPTQTTSLNLPQETPAPTPKPTDPLSIAYMKDSYNPYLVNNNIVSYIGNLLYTNFISISPDFEIEYRIAKEIVNSGTSVSITIASDLRFADGTAITPQDALASFLCATTSPAYIGRFANVKSATVTDNVLQITLAEPDSLFAYLLDIPIMKASDLTSTRPSASGAYTYGLSDTILIANPNAPFPSHSPSQINLVSVTGYDDMINSLVLGDINYTVLSESNTNASSTISSAEHYYKTNTLVYLGVNSFASNPLCNTAEGRILLSDVLARQELVTNTYYERAYVARGVLNPFYACVRDEQVLSPDADMGTCSQTMGLLGYTFDDTSNQYQNERGEPLQISILVHSANSYKTQLASGIVQNFADMGIETTITEVSTFDSFVSLVKSNQFELYIGETKLYNNIDLTPFWSGELRSGIAASDALLTAYQNFRVDSSNARTLENAFADEMPFIPILWRNGTVATSRNIGSATPSIGNPFYSLEHLTVTG